MLSLNCPSCGAPVQFQSKVSVFAVCGSCRSTLLRTDSQLEMTGKMAAVQDEWSPLQIYTTGKFGKTTFKILGRVKLKWERGWWNEWFLFLDGVREGWLAEAQGTYMINFPFTGPDTLPERTNLEPGTVVTLGGTKYTVSDIKDAICSYSEGELPFRGVEGRKSVSIDLSNDKGGFACLDYSDDGTACYIGQYATFEEMNLTNVRRIEGW